MVFWTGAPTKFLLILHAENEKAQMEQFAENRVPLPKGSHGDTAPQF